MIIDGAAGWPVDSLGGKTTLEAARTPRLDRLAAEGLVGMVHTVPEGMEPSSAIACMSVLGFDPQLYYAGRGPIEAMAMGIRLEPGEAALRCNLVTITDGIMVSYAAGHISHAEAAELLAALKDELEDERVRLHAGVGFRNIITVREGQALTETICHPAHDLADKPVADFLPQGPGADFLMDLMERSKAVLADHPVNKARREKGQLPATQIWMAWPGLSVLSMPSFEEAYGKKAALTSAVDLLRGLAHQASIDYLDLPGVTDGNDNDFAGQMAGAIASLEDHDLVFVHVEAPDEAGHAGDARLKIEAIESVDAYMLPQIIDRGDVTLVVLPDHPTPLALKTHAAEPVPFLIWGASWKPNGTRAYGESEARRTGLVVTPGSRLMGMITSTGAPAAE